MAKATEALGQRLFTVEEYDRMVEAGILAEDDRVELIRGVIREMSPKNSPHSIAVWKIKGVFDEGMRDRAATFTEVPIALEALDSKPEPDIAVMSHPDGELFGTDASRLPWCTTPIEAESSLGPDSHHPIISLSGIPSAVMVLRILHPILASTLCAANPLARIAEPTIAL